MTPPNRLVSCTPGVWAMISGRLFDGECAMSSAVMTVEEAPTMPLNCRTPVPLCRCRRRYRCLRRRRIPCRRRAKAARSAPGAATPLPSLVSGRARVLFWSVGGLTSTGGRVVGGVCAKAREALSARMLVASRSARRRLRGFDGGRHGSSLGMTSVARHSEPSLAIALSSSGEANVCTPRPTSSRVTTADGRSPGSRVVTLRRLPRTEIPSGIWRRIRRIQLRGQPRHWGFRPAPHSLLIPKREPSRII